MPLNMFAILLAILSMICSGYAADADNSDNIFYTPNYALANYFGSGFYAGGDLTMVNLPITWAPEQATKDQYRFRFPLSVGFYGVTTNEHKFNIPKNVNILTFAVGIEFEHWVNDSIKLIPFIDVGMSTNFTEGDHSIVYASGITSYWYFSSLCERQVGVVRFQRASYHRHENNLSDGFSSIDTGIDFTLPYQVGVINRFLFATVYFRLYWYFLDKIKANDTSHNLGYDENAQEIGFTLGLKKTIDMKVLSFDRIGFGFRYSNGFRIFRLTFGFPLD